MRAKSRTLSFFHLDGPALADRASASWSREQLRSADHDATCPGGRLAGSIGSPSRGLAHCYQLRVGHKADRRNLSAPQRKSNVVETACAGPAQRGAAVRRLAIPPPNFFGQKGLLRVSRASGVVRPAVQARGNLRVVAVRSSHRRASNDEFAYALSSVALSYAP